MKFGMPSSESNARSIAERKGYELRQDPDGAIIAVDPGTRLRHASAPTWPAMLAWLIRATEVDDGGPSAA